MDTRTSKELRMDAYYYGFGSTGVAEIDLILSAVACAGKAYHHTEAWQDECEWEPHEGKCPVDWIYNAAVKAAEAFKAARAAHEPPAVLPPKLDATMPTVWHYLLVAAHQVVEAVDFNHANKPEPLKWTVPWAKVTALRDAVLKAKMLNGAPGPSQPPFASIAERCIPHIDRLLVATQDQRGKYAKYPKVAARYDGEIEALQALLHDLRCHTPTKCEGQS
jgi:hypothetical protein